MYGGRQSRGRRRSGRMTNSDAYSEAALGVDARQLRGIGEG